MASKSDEIRNYLQAHSDAEAKEVVEALKTKDIEVTAKMVHNVVSRDRAKSNGKKAKKAAPKKAGRKRTKATRGPVAKRPFPQQPLETAMAVPEAFRKLGKGDTVLSDEIATACGFGSKKTDKFYYLAASARDYGLSAGGRDTETMELRPLGKAIVNARNPQTEHQAKLRAFLNVATFKKLFQHCGRLSELAKGKYLENFLEHDLLLSPEFHEEFIGLLGANCSYLGITDDIDTATLPIARVEGDGQSTALMVREKPLAFVIMPFSEKGPEAVRRRLGFFDELLAALIEPACREAGFDVSTAAQKGSDVIQSTIVNKLLNADLVVADLTDHNPNVLFELGIRIAERLPVALIKANDTLPIFDIDNMMRIEAYNPNLWRSTVASDLPKLTAHIRAAWDDRKKERSYMDILRNPQVQAAVPMQLLSGSENG